MTNHVKGARDFDFLFGSWSVRSRRLKERMRGSQEWEEHSAKCEVEPILGGYGNVDRFEMQFHGESWHGTTLRFFNPANGLWNIYWVDNRRFVLDPPMVGKFENGVGTFFGDDVFEERPIRVRFIWSQPGKDEARWEQAFSADGEKTWETNWIMEFTRPR